MLDGLALDLRSALRTFRRSPGFSATAVVSLAIGIAAATGLFSIVNAALLHPFPFADVNRIVRLDTIDKGKPRTLFVTARQLVALQHSDVLDGAFASNTWEMTLTGQGLPEAVHTLYLSGSGLSVLGVPPLLGRVFNQADGPAGELPQRVVVLTYRFWRRHFGGRPEAVGQTLYLNRESYTVIGVLPRQARSSAGVEPSSSCGKASTLPGAPSSTGSVCLCGGPMADTLRRPCRPHDRSSSFATAPGNLGWVSLSACSTRPRSCCFSGGLAGDEQPDPLPR